jgi:peptidoglycan/LPS O-acetylase OafA/YrhL
MTTTGQKRHLQQVDYIRAIASLAVALFHLGGKTLPLLNYGWLGVQMFFVLSGFVICWSIPPGYNLKKALRFLIRRIIRIEPPYLISIVLLLLLNFISTPNYKADWLNVACHLAYINNYIGKPYLNPVYWTLGVEFQFYIFISLSYPLIINKWGKWLLLVLCIALLYINVPGIGLFNNFPLFALGIVYYLYLAGRVNKIMFGLLTACIIFTSVAGLGLLPTCSGLFALLLLLLPLKNNAVVRFFSGISFSLYLTHDIIGSRLVVYLGTLLPKTFWCKGLEFITGIAASIVFAYLFYEAVERPFLKWSKRITYGNHDKRLVDSDWEIVNRNGLIP